MTQRKAQGNLQLLRLFAYYASCNYVCALGVADSRHDLANGRHAHAGQATIIASDGSVSSIASSSEGISGSPHELGKARHIIRSASEKRKTLVPVAAPAAHAAETSEKKQGSHLVLFPPRHSLIEKALASNSSAALASSVASLFPHTSNAVLVTKVCLLGLAVACGFVAYKRVNQEVGSQESESQADQSVLVDTGARDSSIIGALFYAAIWMILSGTLTLYNAWMYSSVGGNFPFVIVLTCWHQFLNIMLTVTVRLFFPRLMPAAAGGLKESGTSYVELFRVVSLISLLVCGTLVLGNKAYLYLSVALIQVIKAAMPLMTYMISCVCGMEKLTGSMTGVIVAIIVGMTMTVTGELKPSLVGLALQFSSFVVEGLRLVCLRRMVSDHGINLDPLSGLFFYAPICFLCLASLAFMTGEFHEALAGGVAALPLKHLLANGVLACGLNIAGVFLLRQASATTLAVCGVLKDLTLVALSYPLFGNSLTPRQIGGLFTILVSVRLYNKLKEEPDYLKQKVDQVMGLASAEKCVEAK